MTETQLRLEGAEGKSLYGKLVANGNRRLVMMVHGLTHHAEHLLEVTGSEFFEENGFDHFSFSLYWLMPDSRKLPESTLTTHVRDVQTVLDYFRPLYDEIFIIGHSLGGLVTLMGNPPGVKAISLWDPSTDVTHFWKVTQVLTYMPEYHQYKMDYGNVYVLGEAMVEEIKLYPDARCRELARAIATPAQLVIPAETIALASPHIDMKGYANCFAGDFEYRSIPGANHVFSKRGNRQALFAATLEWFKKYSVI